LRWYLRSNLFYVLVLESFIVADSRYYWLVWAGATALNLLASLFLVWSYLETLHDATQIAIGSLFVGSFFALLSRSGLDERLSPYDAVNLIYGGCLVALATALGISASAYKGWPGEHARIALVLSMLWIGLAGWALNWPMLWHNPLWQKMNFVLPATFVIAAFGHLGYKLRLTRAIEEICHAV
jgi:hypothetical protein